MTDSPRQQQTDSSTHSLTNYKTQTLHREQDSLEAWQYWSLEVRDKSFSLQEQYREEIDKVSDYVQRDIETTADYLVDGQEQISSWFSFNKQLIKNRLANLLFTATDHSRHTLGQWQTPLMDYNQVSIPLHHNSNKHLEPTSHEHLDEWLTFNLHLIEEHLIEVFSQATDLSRNTLGQWQTPLTTHEPTSLWYTGDIVENGFFYCTQCHESINLKEPGHLPACTQCHHSTFRRASNH
jgi:hypothetical protein